MEKSKHATQRDYVLYHLRYIGALTQIDALNQYGIMRLAARVCELKKMGYKIKTNPMHVTTRYCGETTVASYVLDDDEEKEGADE